METLEKVAMMFTSILYVNRKLIVWFVKVNNTWEQKKCVGAPSPRFQHSAVLVGDSMYVFGGHNNKNALGDMHVLNLGNVNVLSNAQFP